MLDNPGICQLASPRQTRAQEASGSVGAGQASRPPEAVATIPHDVRSESANVIEREWCQAVADAGFIEPDVRLWICTGYSHDGERPLARYFRPPLAVTDPVFLSPEQRAEANSTTWWNRHRFAIFGDFDAGDHAGDCRTAIIGAIFRHELEHALQHEADDEIPALDEEFLDQVIRPPYTDGLAERYMTKPIERDANAAAAAYLRKYHPQHVDAILQGSFAHLARSVAPPEPFNTLLGRTIDQLWQARAACELRFSGDIESFLKPRARALWQDRAAAS